MQAPAFLVLKQRIAMKMILRGYQLLYGFMGGIYPLIDLLQRSKSPNPIMASPLSVTSIFVVSDSLGS
jgi:hypothetical protein